MLIFYMLKITNMATVRSFDIRSGELNAFEACTSEVKLSMDL